MFNAAKILEESKRFQLFLEGANTTLTADELARQERYHHALELIREHSPFEPIAKKVHSDRFSINKSTVNSDFSIAFQLLGKDGMFSKDSMRNWLIFKGMKALVKAMTSDDSKTVPKLLHELYLLSDLNKSDLEIPDFKNYTFPELRFALHPESLKMKNSPEILEEFMVSILKKKSTANFEEAKLADEE